MSKKFIISIIGVFIIILLVIGVTYSYFIFVTNSEKIQSSTGKVDINYSISNATISGMLIPSATRSGGIMENVTAKLNSGGMPVGINLYITPTFIDGLILDAISWEVDVLDTSNNVINHYSGNLSDAIIEEPYKIVDAYSLTGDLLRFDIYIWLNGVQISNENFNNNNSFSAIISADSVNITGEF